MAIFLGSRLGGKLDEGVRERFVGVLGDPGLLYPLLSPDFGESALSPLLMADEGFFWSLLRALGGVLGTVGVFDGILVILAGLLPGGCLTPTPSCTPSLARGERPSGRYVAGEVRCVRLRAGGTVGTVGVEVFFWVIVLAEGDLLGIVEVLLVSLAMGGVEDFSAPFSWESLSCFS